MNHDDKSHEEFEAGVVEALADLDDRVVLLMRAEYRRRQRWKACRTVALWIVTMAGGAFLVAVGTWVAGKLLGG